MNKKKQQRKGHRQHQCSLGMIPSHAECVKGPDTVAVGAIKFLCEMMSKYYGKKVIVTETVQVFTIILSTELFRIPSIRATTAATRLK